MRNASSNMSCELHVMHNSNRALKSGWKLYIQPGDTTSISKLKEK